MFQDRFLTLISVLGTTTLAFIATFIFRENLIKTSSSTPTLYCVSSPSQYITTLNSSLPKAKCFRVQDGLFTSVLSEIPSPNNLSNEEKINYLNGWVLPGIIESHGHVLQYGEMLESVSLYGVESLGDMRERVKEFLGRHEGEGWGTREKWVRGIGWDQAHFGGVMPTAKELCDDPLLSDLYIMLDRVDVHCVLTSQKVLDLLSSPLPEAPPGGVIITDPGPGVFCDNAMDAIIYPLAPKPDTTRKTRWLKTAMKELNKVGIVGMGDAGMRPDDVAILQRMAEKGELSVRMNVMLECEERNTYCPGEIKELKLVEEKSMGGNMLMLGGVKLFADGALGSFGAALLEPYSDKPETSGTMLINETELTSVVKDWYDAGFQVNIHAIGDRANRAAVDAFECVLGPDCDGCNEERRLRIEHAQIIHPDDQKRIAKMGIIPSIQPTHATSDMTYALSRLGPDRLSHSAYRMKSLFPSSSSHSKAPYPGPPLGSDLPVEPPSPFHGLYAAIFRLSPLTQTSPEPFGKGGWYPEERLSVMEAVRGFTVNGAYGWGREHETGKVMGGMWADWVLVDRDVFEGKGRGVRETEVRGTWVAGVRVYDFNDGEGKGREGAWVGKVRRFIEWSMKWILGQGTWDEGKEVDL